MVHPVGILYILLRGNSLEFRNNDGLVHTHPPQFLHKHVYVILSPNHRPSFLAANPTKILQALRNFPTRSLGCVHLILFDYTTQTILDESNKFRLLNWVVSIPLCMRKQCIN